MLLALHGLLGAGENWRAIAAALADTFQVLLPDLRNHGRSPHAREMDYPAMAADVRELLDGLPSGPVFLVGHSIGGKVAMQFAAQWPERVRRLVVVDMAPRQTEGGNQAILDVLAGMDLAQFATRRDMDAFMAPVLPSLQIRQFLLKNVARAENGAWHWRVDLAAIRHAYRRLTAPPELPAPCPVPALFIRGGRSNYIRDQDLPGIRHWFPNSQVKTIEPAGHWVHTDAPAEFLALLRGFLI